MFSADLTLIKILIMKNVWSHGSTLKMEFQYSRSVQFGKNQLRGRPLNVVSLYLKELITIHVKELFRDRQNLESTDMKCINFTHPPTSMKTKLEQIYVSSLRSQ